MLRVYLTAQGLLRIVKDVPWNPRTFMIPEFRAVFCWCQPDVRSYRRLDAGFLPLYTTMYVDLRGEGGGAWAVAETSEREVSISQERAAQRVATFVPHACFLCPYSDHTCDVPTVEGYIRRVELRGVRERQPIVLLETDSGEELLIALPEH